MSTNALSLRTVWVLSFTAELASRIGPMIVLLAYLPILGERAAGMVLLALSYTMTAWLLVDLGLGFYGVKQIALREQPALEIQKEVTKARFLLGLVVSLPLGLVLVTVLNVPVPIAVSFLFYLIVRALAGEWRFRGEERFRALAEISIIASIAHLFTAAILVRPDNWEVTAALPWAVWAAVLLIGTWYRTRMSAAGFLSIPLRRALSHLKTSYGFSLTNGVSVLFGQSPILILSMVYDAATLAQFALLHRVILSSNLFFQTLGAAVFPRIVRSIRTDRAQAHRINDTVVKISIGLSTVIALIVLLAFAIDPVRDTYLAGLSIGTVIAMSVFLLFRGVRESTMRLLLAQGAALRAGILAMVGLGLFAAACATAFVTDSLTITAVAVFFAITEAVILIQMMVLSSRNSAGGS